MKLRDFFIFDLVYVIFFMTYTHIFQSIDGATFAYAALYISGIIDSFVFLLLKLFFVKKFDKDILVNIFIVSFFTRFVFNLWATMLINDFILYKIVNSIYLSFTLSLFIIVNFIFVVLLFSWIRKKIIK